MVDRRRRSFFSDLFEDILRMQREMERMIRSLADEFYFGYPYEEEPEQRRERYTEPLTDIYEDEENVYITMEIPGVRKEDIKVRLLDNRTLEVKAESKVEQEYKDKNFIRRERGFAKFYRRITLPAEVDTKNIKATYNNGILEVKLPKIKKEEKKGIEIKVE
ncbi:MAG: Hsp20/alpha crystallin family protein [Candidatus Asgardarchaeia archaeon]